jgi:hypothetical protein
MKIEELWFSESDLLKKDPKSLLKSIISSDKNICNRTETEYTDEVKVLDDTLVLFITAIQGAYSVQDKWQNDISSRAAVAMANSALNHLLAARHIVLLGYFPEVTHILRASLERITRCYLFFVKENEARKFFEGRKIDQAHVDYEVANILAGTNDIQKEEMLKSFRDLYGFVSERCHPNLISFEPRAIGLFHGEKLEEKVWNNAVIGGLMTSDLVKPIIFRVAQEALYAVSIIKVIFVEQSGYLDKEYDRLRHIVSEYLSQIKANEIKKYSPKIRQ